MVVHETPPVKRAIETGWQSYVTRTSEVLTLLTRSEREQSHWAGVLRSYHYTGGLGPLTWHIQPPSHTISGSCTFLVLRWQAGFLLFLALLSPKCTSFDTILQMICPSQPQGGLSISNSRKARPSGAALLSAAICNFVFLTHHPILPNHPHTPTPLISHSTIQSDRHLLISHVSVRSKEDAAWRDGLQSIWFQSPAFTMVAHNYQKLQFQGI